MLPDVWKHRCILGVLSGDAVDECVPIEVIVRLWLNEGIEGVHELAFFHNHHADAANAASLVVGGLAENQRSGAH